MSLLEKIVKNPHHYNLNVDKELVREIPKDAYELIVSKTKTDKKSILYFGSFLIPNKYGKCNLDIYTVIHPNENPSTVFGIQRYGNKSNNINSLCMNKYEFKKLIDVLEKKLINREYTL